MRLWRPITLVGFNLAKRSYRASYLASLARPDQNEEGEDVDAGAVGESMMLEGEFEKTKTRAKKEREKFWRSTQDLEG